MRNTKIRLIVLLITLSLLEIKTEKLIDISDSTYTRHIYSNPDHKWVILFYLDSCPHCGRAIDMLEKIAQDEYLEDKNISIAKIECQRNTFSCLSYDINTVPHIVFLDSKNMFTYKGYPNEKDLKNFVLGDKMLGDEQPLPQMIGYMTLFLKLLSESVYILDEYMQPLVKSFGFNFNWEHYYSYFVIIVGVALLVWVEVTLVYCCCSPKRSRNLIKPNEASKDKVQADKVNDKQIEVNEQQGEDQKEKKE